MIMIETMFVGALVAIWALLLINIVLMISGYRYAIQMRGIKRDILNKFEATKFVSILIPAFNEEKVIEHTLHAMSSLHYPSNLYEIIVLNDNSTDKTGEIIDRFIMEHQGSTIRHIRTPNALANKGKAQVLNWGMRFIKGEYVAVYDADNTPNKFALTYLVYKLESNKNYAAVIGKFRTRNKNRNVLTRFINIETLSFQWMAQAGRWQLFNITTIPGTNFIIRTHVLRALKGWDVNAIAEDTEISFRIYELGYKIAFYPLAVTFEQEPENLSVWFKQRRRWASGNIYVLAKSFKHLFHRGKKIMIFDTLYFTLVYFMFLLSVIISDIYIVLTMIGYKEINFPNNFALIWVLCYIVFLLQIIVALYIEKGEIHQTNLMLACIMYFTYCQLWIFVTIAGLFQFIKSSVKKSEVVWYKTERY